jgi:hypothetical protein
MEYSQAGIKTCFGYEREKFFHIYANSRLQKRNIRSLVHDGRTLLTEESKADATFSFFHDLLGTPPHVRTRSILSFLTSQD